MSDTFAQSHSVGPGNPTVDLDRESDVDGAL